jgi:hypothetical protein
MALHLCSARQGNDARPPRPRVRHQSGVERTGILANGNSGVENGDVSREAARYSDVGDGKVRRTIGAMGSVLESRPWLKRDWSDASRRAQGLSGIAYYSHTAH